MITAAESADLFRRVFAHIRAHPETWDQQAYVSEGPCGTTLCLAGWAAVFAHPGIDPQMADLHRLAMEALGLSDDDAEMLFEHTADVTDIDELQAIVTDITGVTFPGAKRRTA